MGRPWIWITNEFSWKQGRLTICMTEHHERVGYNSGFLSNGKFISTLEDVEQAVIEDRLFRCNILTTSEEEKANVKRKVNFLEKLQKINFLIEHKDDKKNSQN